MSLLSEVIKSATKVVETLEDTEALRKMRMPNNIGAKPSSTSTVVTPLSCPKCGGAIQVPTGQRQCYCFYCGTPLHIDDGSQTLVYRKVDETRIREAELNESLERARMKLEEKHRPGRIKLSIFLAILGAAMIIAGFFLGHASNDANSPWYVVAILGIWLPISIPYLWMNSRKRS